jgi:hypothetical protein
MSELYTVFIAREFGNSNEWDVIEAFEYRAENLHEAEHLAKEEMVLATHEVEDNNEELERLAEIKQIDERVYKYEIERQFGSTDMRALGFGNRYIESKGSIIGR